MSQAERNRLRAIDNRRGLPADERSAKSYFSKMGSSRTCINNWLSHFEGSLQGGYQQITLNEVGVYVQRWCFTTQRLLCTLVACPTLKHTHCMVQVGLFHYSTLAMHIRSMPCSQAYSLYGAGWPAVDGQRTSSP